MRKVFSESLGNMARFLEFKKIPVIALVRQDIDFSKSTMVLGLPNLQKIIRYKDEDDLMKKLENELKVLIEE